MMIATNSTRINVAQTGMDRANRIAGSRTEQEWGPKLWYFIPIYGCLCGNFFVCMPCATARLTAHYTGACDPNNMCGIETCFRFVIRQRYQEVDYTTPPQIGGIPTYSKKSLDLMTVCATVSTAISAIVLVDTKK